MQNSNVKVVGFMELTRQQKQTTATQQVACENIGDWHYKAEENDIEGSSAKAIFAFAQLKDSDGKVLFLKVFPCHCTIESAVKRMVEYIAEIVRVKTDKRGNVWVIDREGEEIVKRKII